MSNLIKYVKNNANKDFSEVKFNEVDAAIYTILPYLDLMGLINTSITIKELYDKFSKRFILKDKNKFMEENKKLFREMALSKRYQNNIIVSYKKIVNHETQFGAITVKVPKHFKFIAFEGTDDELVGWEENFKMGYMYPIPAQEEAINYLKENIKINDIVVYVGGHSKGGNLAISAVMEQNILKRYQVDYVFNFDGPGFLPDVINKTDKIKKKIKNYYPFESVVGMIFDTNGDKKIIKSNAYQIFQHDLHTWNIENNKFVTAKLSDYSKNFHLKINNILDKFSKEEIKRFVNLFFKMLYNAGFVLKSELNKVNLVRIKNILKESKDLSGEDRKLLLEMFKAFIVNNRKDNEE